MNEDEIAPPQGASVWERELFDHLTNHTRLEGKMLAEYVGAAEGTESKALAYLIGLLVEDEHRHHRHFDELARSLKSEAELSPEDPVVPRLDFHLEDRAELLEVTQRLLQHEKDDAAELKRLHKELHDVEDTTLWALLVELMQRDTEKHMAILRFVEHQAKKGRIRA